MSADRLAGTIDALRRLIAPRLGLAPADLAAEERLHRYGMTSLLAAGLAAEIGEAQGRALPPTLLWDHPTLARLAAFLLDAPADDEVPPSAPPMAADDPVAITGLACRLPGAEDPAAFWAMLLAGVDAVGAVPADRWDGAALADADPDAPGRTRTARGGFLRDVAGFDAEFFGMSPREAAQADPQQRLALMLAWEALEDAGIRPRTLQGSRAGVFMGCMWSDYARLLRDAALIAPHTATGQDTSIVSARIAYALGLVGPAVTLNTACSSSLVAVHQACRSLRAGETRVALAGGVHLVLSPESSIAMTKFGAMAPDGRCKAFDAAADGYVRGEGGALLVLEPLSVARAAGRRVYAVIRGGAVNNDGPSNGLTAPNPAAQRAMLRDALAEAGLPPHAVDYVEAHGTGTALGDPIEANALAAVLGRGRDPARKLRIGSVKTNIGHLEAAAGAAGLVKLCLALHHRRIPASLHFRAPNPAIDFDHAIEVQARATPWPARPDGGAPVGGISSFGFGGTNCHMLLEGVAAPPAGAAGARPVFVFCGNGGNWAGMAGALMAAVPFAASIAASGAALREAGFPEPLERLLTAPDARLDAVDLGQPALVAFQLALADLLAAQGVRPAAVIGHSLGEAAAAAVAGILPRAEALRVVVLRSRLQARLAGLGSMALAAAPAEALRALLPQDVVVAGENGPRATLLSGAPAAVEAAIGLLDRAGIVAQPVRVPVAYHSPQMDALRPELEAALAALRPAAGEVPFVSTVAGAVLPGETLDARYWGANLREPVLFRQGIAALLAAGHRHFLELAPHPLLAPQIRQMAPEAWVASPLSRADAGEAALGAAVAPLRTVAEATRPRLLVLSARTPAALDALAARWAARLPSDFADLCHTALVGRDRFAHRLALVAADGGAARLMLEGGTVLRGVARDPAPPWPVRAPGEAAPDWLARCAAAFVAGAEPDLAALDEGEARRIVTAPTYPFELRRHWLPEASATPLAYVVAREVRALPADGFPAVAVEAPAPDPGLDAAALRYARDALAAVGGAVVPAQRDLAARLAAWPEPAGAPPPAESPAARLLHRVGAALPGILGGTADPLEALFPGGDAADAAAAYAAPPFAAAQAALASTLGAIAGGRALRVMEVGSGTGALTGPLLAALPAGSTLLATDLSQAFLAPLRRRFGTEALSTAIFDLDRPAGADGPFDAIVAANAVHAGRDLGAILGALRARLAPGGVLALAELLRAPRWVDLVFGVTEGWWRFRGDPLRPAHALLDAEGWRRALAAAGFEDVEVRPDGDAHGLVLARAPARRWRVLGDGAHPPLRIGEPADAVLLAPGAEDASALVERLGALVADGPPVAVLAGPGVSHAALLGAARALSLDHPGRILAAVECADGAPETLRAAAAALEAEGAEEQWHAAAGSLAVARLDRLATGTPPLLDPAKLYVVAGGTGRLGQAWARWLAARGARHLLLVSRAARGAAGRHLALDLTSPGAGAALAAALDRPVGGIVHAAGIEDGPTARVLASKLAVAEALEAACAGHAPGFLILCSSAAGTWGRRGHPAYAAANRALDAWAEAARARGLPATSLGFGRFAGAGWVGAEEDAALDAAGLLPMEPDAAFAAGLAACAEGRASCLLVRADWARFRETYTARRARPLLDRLVPRAAPRPAVAATRAAAPEADAARVAMLVAELLGHDDPAAIDPDLGFFEQGVDSLMAVALRRRLEEAFGRSVPAATLFAEPTPARLAAWLRGEAAVPASPAAPAAGGAVAVVGLACRLPGGAEDPAAFHDFLMRGGTATGPLPASRTGIGAPGAGGWLDDVTGFDAAFFRIGPAEAAAMDPQQRLLLETAWHALEHAGIAPDALRGSRTGVFLGATGSDYAALARAAAPDRLDGLALVGQPSNTLAGRIAYQLGLQGPALVLDTACSSALVALHLAVQALRRGEAEMALAGGVNLVLAPEGTAMLRRAGLLSPSGRCAAFDAEADGYVRGEACGLAVLKPLERAEADGDRILAVIRGAAVNHDGRSSSFTAPNGAAQAAVIRAALADAGLAPHDVSYVEAHGTGTALGDPIELDALAEVFGPRGAPLRVGSVKAAVGHAEAAAGIVSLAKVVGALNAGEIPPQPHFATPNPHAAPATARAVATSAGPGRFADGARRAGISGFGASGTNAHLVVEAPAAPPPERGEGPARLLLSAASPAALEALRGVVLRALQAGRIAWADACHTAFVGRARLGCWLLAESPEALATAPAQSGPAPDLAMPRGRRAALPPTPFERRRHWLDHAPAATLLGPPRRSARSGEEVREGRLTPGMPWLDAHRVDGTILLPATGFLALASAAGLRALQDVAFLQPLPVAAEGTDVQLVRERDGALSLHAMLGEAWQEVAVAQAAAGASLDAPRDRPGEAAVRLDAPAFGAELAAHGFDFGAPYRLVRDLRRDGRTARAALAPPTEDGIGGHAALLDAAIQTLTALLPPPDGEGPFLPARIARVVLSGAVDGAAEAGARLRALAPDRAEGDAWIRDARGGLVALFEGLELRRAPATAPAGWLHDVIWRAAEAPATPLVGRWHAIGPGAAALGVATADETGDAPLPADADGVIDLRPLAAATPAQVVSATAVLVRHAAALPRPPQVVLVSRGAATAPPVPPGAPPAAAVLMGLQPVIGAEHPELRCRWLDLDPADPAIPGAPGGPDGRFALRHGRLLVPEVARSPALPQEPLRLRPGETRSLAGLALRTEAPLAVPGPGEVTLAPTVAGLNFKDTLAALGRVPAPEAGLGLECAGRVVALGPGVAGLSPGDAAIAFGPGCLASEVTLPAARVIRRPDWLAEEVAASLPVAFLTAWHGLHDLAGLRPGQSVLVHAGAGGVGGAAVQLARAAGARVFATASAGKQPAVLAAGADAAGDSRSTRFVPAARGFAGEAGFDVVLNALGPEIAEASAALLRPGGVLLEIGNAPPPRATHPVRHVAYDLDAPIAADPGWYADRMARILALLEQGRIAAPPRAVLPLAQAEAAFQALAQGATRGKLLLRLREVPCLDGTWLVTGGAGAVGRAIAGWLAAHGAEEVVLASRRPAAGTDFRTEALDVTDPAAVATLLARLPNLTGIVHAAGVLRDATLAGLGEADIAAVLAPKVEGARVLDAATRRLVPGLRHFVLVGSTAGSLPAPGQAAYAAANAWLDRFAAARRAEGLPAMSVAFGPWAGEGMAAGLGVALRARLEEAGLHAMPPRRAAAAFGLALADGLPHRIVADRRPPARPAPAAPAGALRAALDAAADRRALLLGEVGRRAAALLGLPRAPEPDRALRDLGLDSLLSVSLRNELAAALGLDLPSTLLFDHPTPAALTAHLLGVLGHAGPGLESLDEADLAALLAAELDG